jgi:hypothetical protein
MSWVSRFIYANWNYLIGGLVLLMVFICGVQIGESRIQREWNAEKLRVALVVAKQEQRVADKRHAQQTINQEISNEFQTKKSLLAGLRPALRGGDVGLRIQPSQDPGSLPIVSTTATGVAAAPAYAVPDSAGLATGISCEQLARDAAETTLMVLELQRWHGRQSAADGTSEP